MKNKYMTLAVILSLSLSSSPQSVREQQLANGGGPRKDHRVHSEGPATQHGLPVHHQGSQRSRARGPQPHV